MLKLYYAKGTCSSTVVMTAKSLGIDVELITVDITQGLLADGSDYKAVTEKAYVPALQLENGEVITEVVAICAYLSSLKAGNDVFPLTGKGLIEQLEWFNYISAEIHKTFGPLFGKAFGADIPDSVIEVATAQLTHRYQYIEKHLEHHVFLTGEKVTSADYYLLMTTLWAAPTGYNIQQFSRILAFQRKMMGQTVVQEALA